MKFLNKLFNKKTYNIKKKEMAEQATEKIYIWVKSERAGKIVVEDKLKDGWLYFTDGSRVNPKLLNEYLDECPNMVEAEERSKILKVGNTGTTTSTEKVEEKPTVSITSKDAPGSSSTPVFDEDDLMVGILEKLSKKNKTNLDVSVGIKLPSKTIFKALQQDVDDDELRRGLEKLVKKQINNIEEQLQSQVKQFIQNYYYEQTRKKKSV